MDAEMPLFNGGPVDVFSRAYVNLRPYVRWHEWGGQSISQIVTRPGRQGVDESRLFEVLADPVHKLEVKLSAEESMRLQIWIDANAPFFGTYREEERQAQREGLTIAPPKLQ
jgi:hypothetical protein